MITIARIDERLIHGQIAYAWSVEYKSDAIMAIDDEVANDDLQKSLLQMATPKECKCFVVCKEKAVDLLKKFKSKKIFIVAKDPKVFLYLIKNHIEIKSINVGGIYFKEGRRKISKTIYLDDSLESIFRELSKLNISLDTRTTPRDTNIDLIKLLDSLERRKI